MPELWTPEWWKMIAVGYVMYGKYRLLRWLTDRTVDVDVPDRMLTKDDV